MHYTYKYPHPAVTVDTIVTAGNSDQIMVLLVRRRSDPFRDKWALPGGFIDIGETLLDACRRELEEETGLKDINLKQFYTFDTPGRDPRERVISVAFFASLPEASPIAGYDDAAEAKWFPVFSLPKWPSTIKRLLKPLYS